MSTLGRIALDAYIKRTILAREIPDDMWGRLEKKAQECYDAAGQAVADALKRDLIHPETFGQIAWTAATNKGCEQDGLTPDPSSWVELGSQQKSHWEYVGARLIAGLTEENGTAALREEKG